MVTENQPKGYYLRANKSKALPIHHIFFDTETWEEKGEVFSYHNLRLGVACYWRRGVNGRVYTPQWITFKTADEFWNFVFRYVHRKQTLYLIAHNIAFDFAVVHGFDAMKQRGGSLDFVYTNGSTVIVKYSTPFGKVVLLDSMNWFKVPLRELGKSIGREKMSVDFATVNDEDLEVYCRNDVAILLNAMQHWYKFLDEHDLGRFGNTIASQAMHAFRHRFMGDKKILVHKDEAVTELERRAYHGGRCSVFQRGLVQNTIYKLDINSAYPYVMRNYPYPIKLLFHTTRCTIEELEKYAATRCVIADVTVNTNEPVYPYRMEDRTIYPIGVFRAYLSTEEVVYALKHGHIQDVHAVAVYEKAYIFTEYVDYFYNLRVRYTREGNTTYRYLTKLFLNSLYGKFGQRKRTFVKLTDTDHVFDDVDMVYDTKTGECYHLFRWGDALFKEVDEGETEISFPAIAAHVTANTRLYLWNLIKTAGLENVYYCDTDSILCNATGHVNLYQHISPDELGKLKIEDVYTDGEFLAPKVYRLNDEWKRKGIPPHAKEVDPLTFEYTEFPSLRTLGHKPEEKTYFTRKITKKITATIKGYIGLNALTGIF